MSENGSSGLQRSAWVAQIALGVIATVYAIRETSFLMVPLAVAVFVAILVWPLHRRVSKILPGPLPILVTGTSLAAVIGTASWAIAYTLSDFASHLPSYPDILQGLGERARDVLPTPGELPDRLADSFGAAARGLVTRATIVALTMTFLIILVGESRTWQARIQSLVSRRAPHMSRSFDNVAGFFRRYMLLHSFVSVLTGVLTALVSWAFGVRDPHVWGLLTFFLNYIPNVGSLFAVIPPSIVAFSDLSPELGITLFFVLGSMQFMMGNWFEPWLMGRSFQLSAVVALSSVVFWGWVLGIGGALLAVPLTIFLFAIARESEQWQWVAELLSARQPPEGESADSDAESDTETPALESSAGETAPKPEATG